MRTLPVRKPEDGNANALAQADRTLATRAARAVPGRAGEILARAGAGRPPLPGDELPPDLAETLAARWR